MNRKKNRLNVSLDQFSQLMDHKYYIFHDSESARFVDNKQEALLRFQLPEIVAVEGWNGDTHPYILLAYTRNLPELENSFVSSFDNNLAGIAEILESEDDAQALKFSVAAKVMEFEDYFELYPKLKEQGIIKRLLDLVDYAESCLHSDNKSAAQRLVEQARNLVAGCIGATTAV